MWANSGQSRWMWPGAHCYRADMTSGVPISMHGLTKNYGAVPAVNDLTFDVRPGVVTGFLGPNGAGKTTTMQMLLGLVRPSAGEALLGGKPYASYPQPAQTVGAAFDGAQAHPGHTGIGHLYAYAPQVGVSKEQCDDMLAAVGMDHAARRRVGSYSYGMKQRLSLATALLGDPSVLVLDEPTLGLDPEGIKWLWRLLRTRADEGCTVFVSSHLLSEMAPTVDEVVIIANGELKFADTIDALHNLTHATTYVESPHPDQLLALAQHHGWIARTQNKGLLVSDAAPSEIGSACFSADIEIHALEGSKGDLEESFFRLTQDEDLSTGGER